ncbi:MAG: filamentous hemagglutinin N-terminal domain-containing protein, partial [Pseudomonadota bacterium]
MSGRGPVSRAALAVAAGVALALAPHPGAAQVVTDGTLGPATALAPAGFEVAIPQALGQQRGANLFHSFETFSVGAGQLGAFRTDPTVGRVIARVTGGGVSQIDGQVAVLAAGAGLVLAPNVDLVFINPAGITFGPGGQFVSEGGAVHVGAADRVDFADGATFSASDLAGSTLTVAAPSAFGFLPGDDGSVRLVGSDLLAGSGPALTLAGPTVEVAGTAPTSGLGSAILLESIDGRVVLSGGGPDSPVPLDGSAGGPPAGRVRVGDSAQISVNGVGPDLTGSVVIRGADIDIEGGSAVTAISVGGGKRGQITVEGGQIDIAGTATLLSTIAVEAPSDAVDIRLSGQRVRVAENASVDVSGVPFLAFPLAPFGAGIIDITADELIVESGGSLIANDGTGGGRAGQVLIAADRVTMDGFGFAPSGIRAIGSDTFGLIGGSGGTVQIVANELAVSNAAQISVNAGDGGAAGSVTILADVASFTGTALLQPQIDAIGAFGGSGGRFALTADTVLFDNADVNAGFFGFVGAPVLGTGGEIDITARTITLLGDSDLTVSVLGSGAPGRITLTADETIDVLDQSAVFSDAFGPVQGGDVELTAGERITVDGASSVASIGDAGGSGGGVTLRAPTVRLSDDALVTTTTLDTGMAGDVMVFAYDITLEDRASINSATLGKGDAGSVFVSADGTLRLIEDSSIFASAEQDPDLPPVGGTIGAGGDIEIVAGRLEMTGDGDVAPEIRVSSNSPIAGDAGEVIVRAGSIDLSRGAEIRADAVASGGGRLILTADGLTRLQDAALQTNVATGDGTGGDISVTSSTIVADADSAIIATALDGDGGRIFLSAAGVFLEPSAVIDASSLGGGIDGTVQIEGAEENPTDLAAIDASFLDPRQVLRDPCLSAASGRSSLTVVAGQAVDPAA